MKLTTEPRFGEVIRLLRQAPWAAGRNPLVFERATLDSSNFGVLDEAGCLIGYARLVTDWLTIGYVADVIVDRERRGDGVGTMLLQKIVSEADSLRVSRLLLHTQSPKFYERFNFRLVGGNVMERKYAE